MNDTLQTLFRQNFLWGNDLLVLESLLSLSVQESPFYALTKK